MLNKLLASNLLMIILQYGMLLLMCFFLYRVIHLTYLDFFRSKKPMSEEKLPGKLKVVSRGFLASDQTEFLLPETINIGRSEINDIVINETTVSFEHACITYYHGKYVLSDLKSTNGTLHNHIRLQDDMPLSRGDEITIGSTIFQFEE